MLQNQIDSLALYTQTTCCYLLWLHVQDWSDVRSCSFRFPGKHGGSALQGLGWSACVPKAGSKGAKLCTCFTWFSRLSQLHYEPYLDIPCLSPGCGCWCNFGKAILCLMSKAGLQGQWSPGSCAGARCAIHMRGDERHCVFDCPHFAHIRRQFRSLFQDADGTMQSCMCHRNQKAVCHRFAAILTLADDSSMDVSS